MLFISILSFGYLSALALLVIASNTAQQKWNKVNKNKSQLIFFAERALCNYSRLSRMPWKKHKREERKTEKK